jgi:hypothetical protein
MLTVACANGPGATLDASPSASNIRALRWISPDADRVAALTLRPAVCRRVSQTSPAVDGSEGGALSVRQDIGRLAFESPALLGGAAARMGLSCSSCHLNGRGNPDFFVEAVSGVPGTADVTSSLFSKVRGDGDFNPVPIPDIAARDGTQIRDRASPEFRDKVHGLVVEEFDGQEPPPRIFDDLMLYHDSLALEGCEPNATEPVLAGFDLRDAGAALTYTEEFQRAGKTDEAILMTRVARSVLERLYERFVAPDQQEIRSAIVAASRAIETWRQTLARQTQHSKPGAALARVEELVNRQERRSLYNPEVLRAVLAAEQ